LSNGLRYRLRGRRSVSHFLLHNIPKAIKLASLRLGCLDERVSCAFQLGKLGFLVLISADKEQGGPEQNDADRDQAGILSCGGIELT
jgi:hypothetical protein